MTSELESDALPTGKIDEQINSEQQKEPIDDIPLKTPEVSDPPAVIHEPTKPIDGEEQMALDPPKRSARKKREPTSAVDQNLDHEIVDTQPLFEQPIIVEGKRSRKPTSRLELSESSTSKTEAPIPEGHGKALGEIPYINYQITHASTDALSRMRTICYGRRGGKTNVRDTLRDFKGFDFSGESDEYQRHLSNLTKLRKDQLRSLSDILGLSAAGRNTEHAERILHFLMEPTDDGKVVPERKGSMRSSKSSSLSSKESKPVDEDGNGVEKMQNGDENDELFDDEDEPDEDEVESDEDYMGSDDEIELTVNDDPDDFVYQPGKKAPKRKSPLKRSRSSTRTKRKRASTSASKRRGTPAKKAVERKKTTEETTPSVEPATSHEDTHPGETNRAESIDEPRLTIDTKQVEQMDDGSAEQPTLEAVEETR